MRSCEAKSNPSQEGNDASLIKYGHDLRAQESSRSRWSEWLSFIHCCRMSAPFSTMTAQGVGEATHDELMQEGKDQVYSHMGQLGLLM